MGSSGVETFCRIGTEALGVVGFPTILTKRDKEGAGADFLDALSRDVEMMTLSCRSPNGALFLVGNGIRLVDAILDGPVEGV